MDIEIKYNSAKEIGTDVNDAGTDIDQSFVSNSFSSVQNYVSEYGIKYFDSLSNFASPYSTGAKNASGVVDQYVEKLIGYNKEQCDIPKIEFKGDPVSVTTPPLIELAEKVKKLLESGKMSEDGYL